MGNFRINATYDLAGKCQGRGYMVAFVPDAFNDYFDSFEIRDATNEIAHATVDAAKNRFHHIRLCRKTL